MAREGGEARITGFGIVPLFLAIGSVALLAVAAAAAARTTALERLADPAITVVVRQPSLMEAAVGRISPLPGIASVRIPGPASPPLEKELSDLLEGYNDRTFLLAVTRATGPAELSSLALRIRGFPEVEEVGADSARRAASLADLSRATRTLALAVAAAWFAAALAVARGAVTSLRATAQARRLLSRLGARPAGIASLAARAAILPLLAVWAIPWCFWILFPSALGVAGPGAFGTVCWFGIGVTALAVGTLAGVVAGRQWR